MIIKNISNFIRCSTTILLLCIFVAILFGNEEVPYNFTYLFYLTDSLRPDNIKSSFIEVKNLIINTNAQEGKEEEGILPSEDIILREDNSNPIGSSDYGLISSINEGCLEYDLILPNDYFNLDQWNQYKLEYKELDLNSTIQNLGIYYCLLESDNNGIDQNIKYRWIGKSEGGTYVSLDIEFDTGLKPINLKLTPISY